MEEQDFGAMLIKLTHDYEQLSAKIDDRISSLREELKKGIVEANLTQIRDASLIALHIRKAYAPDLSEACDRASNEIGNLSKEYVEELSKVSPDEFGERHPSFKGDINRIARSAGLKEIWGRLKD